MRASAMRILRLVAVGFVVPCVASMVVYFGFVSTYTAGVFNEASFRHQYEVSVFKYRPLGRWTVLATHELLERLEVIEVAPRMLRMMDAAPSARFYMAYFVHNTVFMCLTCVTLVVLLGTKSRSPGTWVADQAVLMLGLLMALTQYVIVPYDALSYFLLALGVSIAHARPRAWHVPALCGVVVLATLTRESSVLVLACYAAVHHGALLARHARTSLERVTFVLAAASFVATYVAMRFAWGWEGSLFADIQLGTNLLTPMGLVGIAFFAAWLVAFLVDGKGRRESAIFLLASVPYVASILLVARADELRVWVPLIIGLVTLKLIGARADDVGGGDREPLPTAARSAEA